MARIHPTITLPAGCAMPSLGTLLGTTPENNSFEAEPKPSLFGEEADRSREDFMQKHVDPARRTGYYLRHKYGKLPGQE
jgi:hypothetical protein